MELVFSSRHVIVNRAVLKGNPAVADRLAANALQPKLSVTEDDRVWVGTICHPPFPTLEVSYCKFIPLPRLLITGDVHLQNMFTVSTV